MISGLNPMKVIALINSSEAKQFLKLREALAKLSGLVIVHETALVADEVGELELVIESAEIVLLAEDGVEQFPELLGLIRSLRPLADIWQIADAPRAPDTLTMGFDDALGMELFKSSRLKPLRAKIERRLHQKSLLAQMGIVSRSQRMGLIAETIDRVAPTDASVLIVGPSGSGKELVARAIHQHSRRNGKPFVALNCGAMPEGLIESELFGHRKGAFTGSVGSRLGYFSQADHGTIFLDEIGEMKADMQVKLLRALEEGVFYPLGSDRPISVDVRTVSATNRELEQAIGDSSFREDLYYRLSAIKISIPPLCERPEDIAPLLLNFAGDSQLTGFSEEALQALEKYYWPGNVRQLKNFVTRTSALIGDGEVGLKDVATYIAEQQFTAPTLPMVTPQPQEQVGLELVYQALMQLGSEVKGLKELIVANLPNQGSQSFAPTPAGQGGFQTGPSQTGPSQAGAAAGIVFDSSDTNSVESVEDMEAKLIAETLSVTRGNRRIAAERLGIGERTLYRKMKKYGLS